MVLKQTEEAVRVRPTLPLSQSEAATEHGRVAKEKPRRRRAGAPLFMSRQQKVIAAVSPLAYGGCLVVLERAAEYGQNALIWYLFLFSCSLGACLFCLWLGCYLRYRRAGAIAGAWAGFGMAASILLASYLQAPVPSSDAMQGLFLCLVLGAVLGTIGAVLGQWLRGRPTYAQAGGNR